MEKLGTPEKPVCATFRDKKWTKKGKINQFIKGLRSERAPVRQRKNAVISLVEFSRSFLECFDQIFDWITPACYMAWRQGREGREGEGKCLLCSNVFDQISTRFLTSVPSPAMVVEFFSKFKFKIQVKVLRNAQQAFGLLSLMLRNNSVRVQKTITNVLKLFGSDGPKRLQAKSGRYCRKYEATILHIICTSKSMIIHHIFNDHRNYDLWSKQIWSCICGFSHLCFLVWIFEYPFILTNHVLFIHLSFEIFRTPKTSERYHVGSTCTLPILLDRWTSTTKFRNRIKSDLR